MTLAQGSLLAAAATAAGLINSIAGGGTLVTFPALLAAGVSPVAANATNTLAVWAGQLSGSLAYRRHLGEVRRTAILLAVPSILGGLIGSVLLLALPERTFEAVVPWLIVFACALLALQDQVKLLITRVRGHDHPAALWFIQLLVSIYGGYFGAGIGIIMLAAMGILLPTSQQHANALKVLFSFLANGVAALIFLGAGAARLPEAALMAVFALLGGWLGARVAQRLNPAGMRTIAIAVGLYAAARLFAR
ncbi:MAG TPA: sulfite exporter TauE/SafE family protein [Anaeromyxobacteraceae bacterium]|nr:sulfite exporter TauE/SafE family protein [Anaeromyxobacteraceae bacterium]